MPTVIDNRIVEMQFNNKQFEQNVSTSMSTLEKLKNALNFSSTVSNFGDVTKTFSRFGDNTLNEVAANVQALSDRFSTWGIVGMQVIQDLTHKATEFASQALRPITQELDKINVLTNYTQGWDKYAQKTTAVQTIMSATTSTWEESAAAAGFAGTQMEYVSEALDKLNWFSDETSYGFTDMTNNIGKFTAQGVDLDTAVEAMEGISVWAAKSGQGTNEAARAMYNLSQALGVGAVKLMDWKSIENANMATMEFKDTVLEAAASAGTLKKSIDSDGKAIYKTLNGMTVGAENFSQTLSESWFTKDVLLSTLSKYGNATTLLADISADYNVTASQFLQSMDDVSSGFTTMEKASKELGIPLDELTTIIGTLQSEEYSLGLASFRMAQEAKTFSEAMDATADATSTAWMNVFETIFGNYEEAKVLWTRLANDLWDIFAGPVVVLGDALAEWKELGGRTALFDGIHQAWVELSEVGPLISETLVSSGAFKSSTEWGESFAKSTAKFRTGIEIFFKYKWDKVLDIITNVSKVFGAAVVTARRFFSSITTAFSKFKIDWMSFDADGFFGPIETSLREVSRLIETDFGPWVQKIIPTALERIGTIVQKIAGIIGQLLSKLGPAFQTITKFLQALTEPLEATLFTEMGSLADDVISFFDSLGAAFDRFASSDSLQKLQNVVSYIGDFIGNVWSAGIDILFYIIDGFGKLVDLAVDLWDNLDESAIKDVFDQLREFRPIVQKLLEPAFDGLIKFVTSIGNLFVELIISGAISRLIGFFADLANKGAELVGENVGGFFGLLAKGVDKVTEHIPTIVKFFDDHLPNFTAAIKSLMSGFSSIGTAIGSVIANFFGLFDDDETDKASILGKVVDGLSKAFEWIGNVLQNIGPIVKTVFEWLFEKIKTIGPTALSIIKKIGSAISTVFEKVKGLFGEGSGFSLDTVFKIFQNGALSAILVEIFKMFQNGAKGAGGIVDIINGVKDGLSGLTKKADGPDIKSIALSILMIAGACVLLSAIDPTKLTSVLFGLASALTELVAAFALLATFGGTSTLDEEKSPIKSLINSLTNKNDRNSTGSMMLKMAASLLIVAGTLKILGSMNWEQIEIGLQAMAAALSMLVAALLILELAPNIKNSGSGLMTASLGLIGMALALKLLGTMNAEQISKSLSAMVGALGLLTTALIMLGALGGKAVAGAAALLIGSTALIVLAGALLAFGVVLGLLSVMQWDKISEKLAPLAGILLAVVGIGTLMGVLSPLMLLGALGVAALGASLLALGKGLLVYTGALAAIQLAGGFGAMAGSLAILAGLGTILAVVSPLLLIASVGMLAFGAALKVLGEGLLIFSAAVAVYGLSMDVVMASIKFIALELIGLIPALFTALANGLVQMFVVIGEKAGLIAEVIGNLLLTILQKLGELIPVVVDLVFDLLTQLLTRFGEFAGTAVEVLLTLLEEILTSLAEHIPTITEQAVLIVTGFITGFLEGLAEGLPDIIQASWDLVISFVDGIADGIDNNWDRLMDAFKHLFESVIGAIKRTITGAFPELMGKGQELIDKIKMGISSKFGEIKEKFFELIRKIKEWIAEKWEDLKNAGKNLIDGFKEGISSKATEIADKAKEVASGAVNSVKKFLGINSPSRVFAEIGAYTMEGFANGISDNANLAEDSLEEVGASVSDALTQALQNASLVIDGDEPVITPVVDMTNIDDSARLISSLFGDTAAGAFSISNSSKLASLPNSYYDPNGVNSNSAYSIGTINFTIIPQPGQDAEEIADEVMNRLNTTLLRGKAVWA